MKVALIGAGSGQFAQTVITDILAIEGLDAGTFALVDLDPERLELTHEVAEQLIELVGKPWMVQATTDRRSVLPGCDYVINMIEVGGLANVEYDYTIPLKYIWGGSMYRRHERAGWALQVFAHCTLLAGHLPRH